MTHKWHELLVLSTCAFSAINSNTACIESLDAEIRQSMSNLAANLAHLNATSNGTVISCAQLELEAGGLVSELCSVRFAFKSIGLTLNEFVALKVIAMTSIVAAGAANGATAGRDQSQPQPDIPDPSSVLRIRDRYLKALVSYLSHKKPPLGSGSCSSAALALNGSSINNANNTLGPNAGHVLARMNSLLNCLAQVSTAANLLLQSKMFYVPFLMNSSSITTQTNGHYNSHHLPHHLSHHPHLGIHHYEHHRNSNGAMSVNGGSSGANSTSSSRSASSSPPSTANGPTTNGLTNGTTPPTAILAGSGSNCS